MRKKIAILGSTGSIGKTLLKVLEKDKKNIKIYFLTANKNYKELIKQAKKFNVKNLIVKDKKSYLFLKKKFQNKNIKIYNNYDCFKKIIKKKLDYVMSSIVGLEGLKPTFEIIRFTKKIAVANKESLICAWNLINKELKKNNTEFIPVDSEHFSISKLLENHKESEIKKIYLTASGGPFLNFKHSQLRKVKPKDAIKHPKWRMGKKISVDSATLMNKILELIEAQKLFNIPMKKLEILIHPESLVHAILELKNGLKKFIYHETSMIIPLANAMFDGNLNIDNYINTNLNKNKKIIENLVFEKVDKKIFPIIKLKNIANKYPSSAIIINASNEILVDHFLRKKIPFLSISKIIMGILRDRNYKKYAIRKPKNIEQINKIDNWARQITINKIK